MGIVEAVMIAGLMVVVLILVAIISSLYQKCGPNEALIITGGSQEPKVLVAGGTVVIPMLNQMQTISLELMEIELKNTISFPSISRTAHEFDGILEASIDSNPKEIEKAAQCLGGKDVRDIRSIIYNIAQDSIRKCISGAHDDELELVEPIAEDLKEMIQAEVLKYGIKIHGLRIREIRPAKRPKENLSSTVEVLKLKHTSMKIDESLDGAVAIVTKLITNDQTGEVTYKIANSSQRVILAAKPKLPGKDIDVGSVVVIKNITDEIAEVTPWSDVFYHYPVVIR